MDFVEQLKSSVDIARVIGEYVRLRKASAQRYQGLCPFHSEKTASFSVYLNIQRYKCFGCGASGDVLTFVQEIEGISFYEALKLLAERNGIPMPKRSDYSDPQSKLRAALLEMHEIAARMFQTTLHGPAGSAARAYLSKRGLAEEQIDEFALGLSDPSGQSLTRKFQQDGFTPEQLEKSGLARRRDDGSFYDTFRGRLMFPIHNESGKVVAFGGRTMKDEEPKYLNSPATDLYQKSQVLYNLNRAKNAIRKFDHTVLVEGYMDVIGVYAAGVHEVVASCGTALTNAQVRALKRHSERIVVNFDPDAAGSNATERSIQMLLDENMHIRVLELEGGLDPDEYVKQSGADAYRAKLDSAGSYFHWLADRARQRFDMRDADGRIAGFQFLLPAIQRISDKLERMAIANDVAGYLGVDAGLVLDQFRKSADGRKGGPARAPKAAVPPVERMLLQAVLLDEESRHAVLPQLRRLAAIENFATRRVFEAVFQAADSGSAVDFSQVEGRLDEANRALLHEVIFADHIVDETVYLDQALACLRRLEEEQFESQRAELRARVKSAEREGKLQDALHWMKELGRLEKPGG
jgi:DNA primase